MTMDINDLRIVITALSFLLFAGIVYWAFGSRQRARFEEAANLPFVDEDLPGKHTVRATGNGVRP